MDIGIEGLHKRFGSFPALRGIDLKIPSGQLLALLGPSGSGKTTLLRALAGLEEPDGGRIVFGERDATRLSLRERRVGLVFQHYALFPHLSVFENIAFGLRCRRRRERPSPAELTKRVDELLERMQITALRDRLPDQISGGQKQRVALARAMAIDPSVLLLDEPFGALDAKVRSELRRWLRMIHEQIGYTTVFVTHDQEEALELADRIVVVRAGAIEQDGTPDEVYGHPASAFVFDFIGRSSHLTGQVRDGVFHPDGSESTFACAGVADGASRLFVRPQHLQCTATGGLAARVMQSRALAGRRQIRLELPHQANGLEMEIGDDGDALAAGAIVRIAPTRFRVFLNDAT